MKILLKIFVSLIIIYSSIVNAQDLSKYYGTYSGKLSMGKDIDISPNANYETNDISVKVEQPNKISIDYHLKITSKDDEGNTYALEYKGNNEGIINNDLSYSIKGNITVGTVHWETKQWVENTSSTTLDGKLSDNSITGNFQSSSGNKVRSLGLSFKAAKKSGENKCDISISVPPDIKPGGDFYVMINKIGCVSYYTIYYNGKDKPITNWDGKEVDVEVQVECCDHSAFMKKLKVPAFGSNIKSTEIKQITGKPTDPEPKEIAGGITAGLLLVKLLQLLTSGKGPKTATPPPVPANPINPPKQTIPVNKDKPVDKGIKDKTETTLKDKDTKDIKNKVNNDVIDNQKKNILDDKIKLQKSKRDLRYELEKKLEKLRLDAKYEGLEINTFRGITNDLFKTIPSSYNEVKNTCDNAHNAFDRFKEFGEELVNNPKERGKFKNNVSDIAGNLKDTCVNYYKNMEFIDDIKDLSTSVYETNVKFIGDLRKSPVNTLKKYASDMVGGENYEKALDSNTSLPERLCNLGIGYYKTLSTLSTGETSIELYKNLKGINFSNIASKEVEMMLDGKLIKVRSFNKLVFSKIKSFKDGLSVAADLNPELEQSSNSLKMQTDMRKKTRKTFNELLEKKGNNTIAYDVNDKLSQFNKWYEENLK